jgi:hypothetical protein
MKYRHKYLCNQCNESRAVVIVVRKSQLMELLVRKSGLFYVRRTRLTFFCNLTHSYGNNLIINGAKYFGTFGHLQPSIKCTNVT